MQDIINNRFKDAPWYERSKDEKIMLIGVGGIGSNTIYYLSKTIPATYFIVDGDTVDEHNIGTQFFFKDQIRLSKVAAMTSTLVRSTNSTINPIFDMFSGTILPITITGFDNMKARREAFEAWNKLPNKELFIDGRLRANLYEIYVVTPGREVEYEKTLFDDSEADDGPCTFKQTAYFAGLIGCRITHVVVNYLTNKYSEIPICSVPFSIKEVGEMFYSEIIDQLS